MAEYFRTARLLSAHVAFISIASLMSSHALAGSCCSSQKTGSASASTPDCHSGQHDIQRQAEDAFKSPHGGQLSRTLWNYLDVVYGAHETRIYMYDMFRQPVSARGIQGQAIMRVRSNGREYRYPVDHVPVQDGHDYLAVRVNLTSVEDGDMDVRFELTNVPNDDQPNVEFTQTFAMTQPARPNELAHGARHISRLPSVSRQDSNMDSQSAHQPRISVATASSADDAAIQAQRLCPVSHQPLGDHGRPAKITVDGQSVFVCCNACVDPVKEDPDLYLARIAR